MRRLYFLVPGVDEARRIVDELLLAHVEWRHIHVIAREGTPLGDLPEATLAQKSDVIPALERGAAVGGVTGMLVGLVAVTWPPAGVVYAGGALLIGALGGAGFGAFMSTMVGVDVPNTRLERFHEAIQNGEVLMMVDVHLDEIEATEELVRKHHPDVEIEGTEPTMPAFP